MTTPVGETILLNQIKTSVLTIPINHVGSVSSLYMDLLATSPARRKQVSRKGGQESAGMVYSHNTQKPPFPWNPSKTAQQSSAPQLDAGQKTSA